MSDRLQQEQSTVKKVLTWPAKVNKALSKYQTFVKGPFCWSFVLFRSNTYFSHYRRNAHFTVASDKVCKIILTQSLVSLLSLYTSR